MEYKAPLITVRDIEASKRFYRELLGCEVVDDFGANVTLAGGLSLQTLDSWESFIETDDVTFRHNAGELYFEEKDMEGFLKKLRAYPGIKYVHELKEHSWGQRGVRFYDPDGNIIEVGESLTAVVRRFMGAGMTLEQTAERMDVSVEYARSCL